MTWDRRILMPVDGKTWPCPECRVVGKARWSWEATDYRADAFDGSMVPLGWRIRFSCDACGTSGFRTREQLYGAAS